jgi:hypothetical protein
MGEDLRIEGIGLGQSPRCSHFLRTANLFNSLGLLLISGVVVWQAFDRLFHPHPVLGIVPIVAGLLAAAGNWE